MVIVNFIRDTNVGMYARVKRKEKGVPLVWDGGKLTPASRDVKTEESLAGTGQDSD